MGWRTMRRSWSGGIGVRRIGDLPASFDHDHWFLGDQLTNPIRLDRIVLLVIDETMINPLNPSFPNPHSRTNTQTHSHSHSHSQSSTNSPSSISFLPQPPHPLPEKQIPSLHAQTQGLEERLWDVIMEQNERIAALEKEWGRLAGLLASQGSGGVGQGGYAGKEFRRNRERSDRDEDSVSLPRGGVGLGLRMALNGGNGYRIR
jgi:hypothetical protein